MKIRTLVLCAMVALGQQTAAEEPIETSLLRQPTLAESAVVPESPPTTAKEGDSDLQAKSGHQDIKYDLLQKKLREVDQLQREIEQLRTELGTQQQILVRVEMLEVSLTKLQKMGIDWAELPGGRFDIDDAESLRRFLVSGKLTPAYDPPTQNKSPAVKGLLDLMVKNRVAKFLAQPTLVTVSGRPACVFVGNELPAPANGDPESSVEYHKCGTELDVLAEALPNENVRLHIRTRVSEPNDARSITVGNTTIPAIDVRACDTSVETKFGTPVVLNGLVSRRTEAIKNESGNVQEEVNEVALMVVVTPELDDSVATAQAPSHKESRN